MKAFCRECEGNVVPVIKEKMESRKHIDPKKCFSATWEYLYCPDCGRLLTFRMKEKKEGEGQ